ncbi:helix-turn-helix domain-containing protein [Providencia vermicola]|uniref:Helix-turn-helix domain-containing protein n=4 Tax=Providencia TaxID=586 RepID=A0AAX3S3D4_9GAMM|nr:MULTISPECIES: helix-turn-helix domain-containing protein [Providencia]MCK1144674.1 helix-turn-helix domain-containing protein [Providencia stuartii]MCR4178509.1 helix-turn-helix domain-containing protein [Providencia vermicola]MTB41053.1 helix-turn-helix domain-containing protein [Providencia sp. wls1949]MTC07977.1 helix-turn-helix domain-containing protein [Providencia sp. wls1948]URE79754.1 helix-turn-helix domain-containing protein [Providencia stuartii]
MYIEQHSRYQNKANSIQLRWDDEQFHITVIKDVLLWIEHNLDQSLLLDDVANKAGYTKWYFQRLFKKVTGITLAAYIRARRLTKAAVELRLTKKTILEIALKYQFDSQQSFTRRFKYIFKVTPSCYRRNKLWNLDAMQPPINFDINYLAIPQIVDCLPYTLYVKDYQYLSSLDEVGLLHESIRETFWADFFKSTNLKIKECYVLIDYQKTEKRSHMVQVFYQIGLKATDSIVDKKEFREINLPSGKYAKFSFKGSLAEYRDFNLNLYLYSLPSLGLFRREGEDIEKYINQKENVEFPLNDIEIEYFVPIY